MSKDIKAGVFFVAIVIFVMCMYVLSQPTRAQDAPNMVNHKDYTPSELQATTLKLKREQALRAKDNLDAATRAADQARKDAEQAQNAFNLAVADLQDEGRKVAKDNGWGADVTMDLMALTYKEEPKAAAKEAPWAGPGPKPATKPPAK